MKDDAVYLRHILECIRRIDDNTREGHTQFLQSHTLQDAALRNLQNPGWTASNSLHYSPTS